MSVLINILGCFISNNVKQHQMLEVMAEAKCFKLKANTRG